MSRAFIVLGDTTSHGGKVISADQTFLIHGKATARVGDLVTCPQCKGTFPIQVGAPDMDSMGMAVAREGDKTACGAILIASQHTTTWDNGASSGAGSATSTAPAFFKNADEVWAPRTPAHEAPFDEQTKLVAGKLLCLVVGSCIARNVHKSDLVEEK